MHLSSFLLYIYRFGLDVFLGYLSDVGFCYGWQCQRNYSLQGHNNNDLIQLLVDYNNMLEDVGGDVEMVRDKEHDVFFNGFDEYLPSF